MGKYNTEEERRTARREAKRRWYYAHKEESKDYYQKNKDKYNERNTEWRSINKDKVAKYNATYRSTPEGRAKMLLDGYKYSDNLYNRGECTLTSEWIIEHIFSEPCHYCGKTDWHELGCDRIDNALPHTPENVVPCCYDCNCKKHTTPYEEYLKLIGKSDTD